MKESKSLGDRLFVLGSYIFLVVMTIFCLFPFWIMIVASFTDDLVLRQDGYLPWAREWSLEAYRWVFKGGEVRTGYMVTIFVTVVGTLSSLFVMSGLAYVMALKRLSWRNKVAFYVFFTMIFTPSLIPWFITCRNLLQLTDSIWALILPMMVQPFWVFVLRNFFAALPTEIMESAYIDGASDTTILFRIVIPLSKPALATVGLFIAVAYWNDWFLALMLLDFAEFNPSGHEIPRRQYQPGRYADALHSHGNGGYYDWANYFGLSLCPALFCPGLDHGRGQGLINGYLTINNG